VGERGKTPKGIGVESNEEVDPGDKKGKEAAQKKRHLELVQNLLVWWTCRVYADHGRFGVGSSSAVVVGLLKSRSDLL